MIEALDHVPPRQEMSRVELEEWMSLNGAAGHQTIHRAIGILATAPNLTQQDIEELTQGD